MRYERGWKARKGLKILFFGALFVAAIGFVVMSLWNWLVPDLFHGPHISFWQAFGLFLLSKILLSGGKPGPWGMRGKEHWREKMRNRMDHMSDEEKEKFREAFRKCSPGRFGRERFGRERGRERHRNQYQEPGFPFDDDRNPGPPPPPPPGSDMA